MDRSYKNVWVFIDTKDEHLEDYAISLLAKGRELADRSNEKLCAFIIGENNDEYIHELEQYKIDDVYSCTISSDLLHDYNIYANIIAEIASEQKPNIFLFSSTMFQKSVSSMLAAQLQTGLTADCTELELFDEDTKLLKQTRPALEGNIMAQIITENSKPQMVTVKPGIFNKLSLELSNDKTRVHILDYSSKEIEHKLELISRVAENNSSSLEKSNIIVAGGRGISSKEDFLLLEQLANEIGGKMAVTRAIVDKGWYGEDIMVGQTGKKVCPDIYFAFGISGALQHTVGIDAKTVIAINTDKDAPIFQKANFGIVGDCMDICRALLKQLRAKNSVSL